MGPGTPQTTDERRFGHAVIFQNDTVGLVDLNDLIDPLLGWTLSVVTDMAGDFVVGTGERMVRRGRTGFACRPGRLTTSRPVGKADRSGRA